MTKKEKHLYDQEVIYTSVIDEITSLMQVSKSDINTKKSISDCGFDSASLVKFTNNLNKKYNLDLTPIIFFQIPDIREFCHYLTETINSTSSRSTA